MKKIAGTRVPRGLCAAIAAYARNERIAGASCRMFAEQLGVSAESIRRWAQRPARPDGSGDGLVPVHVLAEAAHPVTVWAPSGDPVEGR